MGSLMIEVELTWLMSMILSVILNEPMIDIRFR